MRSFFIPRNEGIYMSTKCRMKKSVLNLTFYFQPSKQENTSKKDDKPEKKEKIAIEERDSADEVLNYIFFHNILS